MNKRIFITSEAYNSYKKNHKEEVRKLPQNSIDFFKEEQRKKEPIFIYDRGFNKGLSIIPISNHINKTGKNPLIGKQNNEIKFFDITEIYGFSKQSKIAVCFGQHKPVKIKKNMIATRFLCNHVIAAYCAGFKNIFAYVID